MFTILLLLSIFILNRFKDQRDHRFFIWMHKGALQNMMLVSLFFPEGLPQTTLTANFFDVWYIVPFIEIQNNPLEVNGISYDSSCLSSLASSNKRLKNQTILLTIYLIQDLPHLSFLRIFLYVKQLTQVLLPHSSCNCFWYCNQQLTAIMT